MPFPHLKSYGYVGCSGSSAYVEHHYDETGRSVSKSVKFSADDMPPAENFDLDVLIRNKVPLEKVNCKIFSSSKVSVDIPEETKPSNPEDEGE